MMNKDQNLTRIFASVSGVGESRNLDGLRLSKEEVASLIAQDSPVRFTVEDLPEMPILRSQGD